MSSNPAADAHDGEGGGAPQAAIPGRAPVGPSPRGDDEPARDAFISYSRRDAAFAERLQRALERYTPPPGLGHPRRE